MNKEPGGIWTTNNEIKFIDGIGFPKGHDPTNRVNDCPHIFADFSRKELLQKYLIVCSKRANWGGIGYEGRNKIMNYVQKALKKEVRDGSNS